MIAGLFNRFSDNPRALGLVLSKQLRASAHQQPGYKATAGTLRFFSLTSQHTPYLQCSPHSYLSTRLLLAVQNSAWISYCKRWTRKAWERDYPPFLPIQFSNREKPQNVGQELGMTLPKIDLNMECTAQSKRAEINFSAILKLIVCLTCKKRSTLLHSSTIVILHHRKSIFVPYSSFSQLNWLVFPLLKDSINPTQLVLYCKLSSNVWYAHHDCCVT